MRTKCFALVILSVAVVFGLSGCSTKSPEAPTPTCSLAISPATVAFGSEGGAGNVTVSVNAGCTWSATSSGGWIVVTSGGTGAGPGTVAYSVTANANTQSRSGSLTIGTQSHAITQQGRAPTVCTYTIAPPAADFNKDGGSGAFTVGAEADCGWTATSNAPWLALGPGAQGSGNGTVSYTVARNADIPERAAVIAVADRTFAVRQSGDIGGCQYSVSPVTFAPCMPGGIVSATVTTQASCPWTATPNVSWLGVAPASGTGSGIVTLTFPDNYDPPREGIGMVRWPTPTAGQNIRVAQAGCLYAVSRNSFAFTSAAGSGAFDVIQQSDPITCGSATQDRCVWTAQSDVPWITITSSMPRAGDNPVSFNVAGNDGTTPRTGHITVRDKVVVITQSGR